MRTIAVVLLLTAFAFAQWGGRGGYDPRVSPETDILYFSDGWMWDLIQDNVFTVAFLESLNGADSCAFGLDFDEDTYDYAEVWVTASMTEDNTAGDEQAGAVIQCYPYFAATSMTVADTLLGQSMLLDNDSAPTTAGKLWFTVTSTDSTSGARAFVIGYLLPGETKTWGPFHLDATDIADSNFYAFEALNTDSTEFSWSVLVIPRT